MVREILWEALAVLAFLVFGTLALYYLHKKNLV